jgi:hypothetical protein
MKYVSAQTISSWSDQMKTDAPGSLPVYLAVRDSIAVALYRAGA